jgi:hypothetical protein
MAIYYLDIDDEITSAAARLRDSSDSRIALVLSAGSRVATSRINFRLLAREAKSRHKRLAIIAADPTVQSIARSAELPVYTSVGEYEAAERAVASGTYGHSNQDVSQALDELALTVRPGTAPLIGRAGASRIAGAGPIESAPARKRVPPRSLVFASALLLIAVIAVAGYFFLPGATVVLTLREDPVGPIAMNVTVDPSVTAVNAQAGTVPGISKEFPVEASGTFDATGQKIDETAATGTVTFTSYDPTGPVTIVAGTKVTTSGGVAFATTSTVTVPQATGSVVSGRFVTNPTHVDARVQAVKAGTSGNVAAGAITKMPSNLAKPYYSVTNKAATTGGTHNVTLQIQQADVDAAQASLQTQMQSNLATAMQAAGAVPAGSTIFDASAQLNAVTCDPDPTGLVGTTQDSFQLDCKASGSAVVAATADIDGLAARRAAASVPSGYSLVNSSVKTTFGKAAVNGSRVVVPVAISAGRAPVVDVDKLRAGIKGKSLAEAKAFLAQYGKVDITLWPDWTDSVTSWDFRIDIQIVNVSPNASGSPAPTTHKTTAGTSQPGGTPTPGPSGSPPEPPVPTDTPAPTDTPTATDTAAPTDTPTPTDTPPASPSPS